MAKRKILNLGDLNDRMMEKAQETEIKFNRENEPGMSPVKTYIFKFKHDGSLEFDGTGKRKVPRLEIETKEEEIETNLIDLALDTPIGTPSTFEENFVYDIDYWCKFW